MDIFKTFPLKRTIKSSALMFVLLAQNANAISDKDYALIKVEVEKKLQTFVSFHAEFLQNKKRRDTPALVKKYFSFLTDRDQNYLGRQLELHSMSFLELEGSQIKVFNDKRLKNEQFVSIDYQFAPFGKIIVNSKSYNWDISKNLEWNFENIVYKNPDFQSSYADCKLPTEQNPFDLILPAFIPNAHAVTSCSKSDAMKGATVAGSAASLVSYGLCPMNIVIDTGIAICDGVYTGVKTKSLKEGGKKTLRGLPGIKQVGDVHESISQ
ncbi:hypothetical protein GW916_07605 [bacterium]|nr:hypothetical protein [bacterium]